jgi:hypothetical protein
MKKKFLQAEIKALTSHVEVGHCRMTATSQGAI